MSKEPKYKNIVCISTAQIHSNLKKTPVTTRDRQHKAKRCLIIHVRNNLIPQINNNNNDHYKKKLVDCGWCIPKTLVCNLPFRRHLSPKYSHSQILGTFGQESKELLSKNIIIVISCQQVDFSISPRMAKKATIRATFSRLTLS